MSWMISLSERRRKLWWLQVVQDWRLLDASEGQQKPQPKSTKVARTCQSWQNQWFFTRYISILRTFQISPSPLLRSGKAVPHSSSSPGPFWDPAKRNSSVARIIVSKQLQVAKNAGQRRWCYDMANSAQRIKLHLVTVFTNCVTYRHISTHPWSQGAQQLQLKRLKGLVPGAAISSQDLPIFTQCHIHKLP